VPNCSLSLPFSVGGNLTECGAISLAVVGIHYCYSYYIVLRFIFVHVMVYVVEQLVSAYGFRREVWPELVP
jgi:hypothetical protein